MYERQAFSGSTLSGKPSTVFSTTSSSSTTGSSGKLLFGEIDTSSFTSSSSTIFHNCTVVRSTNARFLRFWHTDRCREALFSILDRHELAKLRLVSLDFSARVAPHCFRDITCSFKAHSFKQSRVRALESVGRHVQTFRLILPYTFGHVLPPLIDPQTGGELNFTYTPIRPGSSTSQPAKTKEPTYGDWDTTDLLVRQYPPLFHAAANSQCFAQVMSALSNVSHLILQGTSDDFHVRSHHRNVSDFAIVSLRASLEAGCMQNISEITLTDLPTSSMRFMQPTARMLATSFTVFDWSSQISRMTASMRCMRDNDSEECGDQLVIIHDYLGGFRNLEHLSFSWSSSSSSPSAGTQQGPFPFTPGRTKLNPRCRPSTSRPRPGGGGRRPSHPAMRQQQPPPPPPPPGSPSTSSKDDSSTAVVRLPHLVSLRLANTTATAGQVQTLLRRNPTLRDLDFQNVALQSGTWDEALLPLRRRPRPAAAAAAAAAAAETETETGDVPIMLAPWPWRPQRRRKPSSPGRRQRESGMPSATRRAVALEDDDDDDDDDGANLNGTPVGEDDGGRAARHGRATARKVGFVEEQQLLLHECAMGQDGGPRLPSSSGQGISSGDGSGNGDHEGRAHVHGYNHSHNHRHGLHGKRDGGGFFSFGGACGELRRIFRGGLLRWP